jgi:hypothetical protein
LALLKKRIGKKRRVITSSFEEVRIFLMKIRELDGEINAGGRKKETEGGRKVVYVVWISRRG